MRFGELEMRAIAATILRSFRLELEPGWQMRVRQMPTLSPRGGLPMRIRAARTARAGDESPRPSAR